jgi:hypothetical protein
MYVCALRNPNKSTGLKRINMNTFAIDSDNNITIFGPGEELPKAEETPKFKSRDELGQLAESWPAERLVKIWNTLPGARPVKKFTNRNTAVSRVWKALQNLNPSGGLRRRRTADPRAISNSAFFFHLFSAGSEIPHCSGDTTLLGDLGV